MVDDGGWSRGECMRRVYTVVGTKGVIKAIILKQEQ